jgi:hypothetical protein
METSVCTVFEKDYHYGVGDLVNSLYLQGYRGVVWAGYKGSLPFWATPLQGRSGYEEYQVAEGCVIRFVQVESCKFLSNYKPDFMLSILNELQPEIDAVFYFDPDIVNKCAWDTYERWVKCGVAICEDGFEYMPVNHPDRQTWNELSEKLGYTVCRQTDRTYNSGFIGVKQADQQILVLWREYLEKLEEAGYIDLRTFLFPKQYPYLDTDQCVLNVVLTLTTLHLSTMDRLAMDLGGSATRNIMSHAAGGNITKPWRKDFIAKVLLQGEIPSLTDKAYWRHTQFPIQLYSSLYYRWKRLDLLFAAALARLIRRPA